MQFKGAGDFFELGRQVQKSSLVKMSPSVIKSYCNVCSDHLEALGFFGFSTCLCPHKSLLIGGWSCCSRVCDYNNKPFFHIETICSNNLSISDGDSQYVEIK